MSKFLLVQTAIGDYRQGVLNLVSDILGSEFQVLTGRQYFEPSILTRVNLGKNLSLVDNVFLFQRKFLVQKGVIAKSVAADSVMLEMNPRIITVWITLLLRKLVGKKTVLWGHAWPREGRFAKSDLLRNVLRSLGNHILVYTDTQKNELSERMQKKSITSAPNALYSIQDMWVPVRERKHFIYVGRLVAKKKPKLMILAYSYAVKSANIGSLIIVGDGPERASCEALTSELGLQGKVKFLGHISNLDELREIYSGCIASLSPGYVGLSITQSFSFGTPMLIADNEPHSPEIEAATEGDNCLFFQANAPLDLSDKMLRMCREGEYWELRSPEIILDCRSKYSTELMSSRIVEAFKICSR